MRYLSVCSGIEAATVAWHGLGWTPAAFSEIEPFPSAVLAHHYPSVPNVGDMTKYKEWDIGAIDLLVGGTPCQSFSVAGLRKGLEDPRGNLALIYCGILDRFRPKWCVWENVPGVLSSNGGRDFGSFLGALAELGYGFAYRVLDAQYFGVAQRRRRVFVVGHLGDWRAAAQVLFEPESLRRDSAPSRETGQDLTTSTASGVDQYGLQRTVGTLCADTHPRAYSGQDAYTGRLVPSVIGALDCRLGAQRAQNAQAGHMIPVNVPDVMCTLRATGAGFDRPGNAATAHETYIPMAPIPYDLHQVTAPVNRQARKPGDPCHTLAKQNAHNAGIVQPMCFQQNTRDEVRYIGGDGQIAGALAAQAGMKQQNYLAQPIGGVDYENNAHLMDEPTGPLLKGSPTGGGRPLPALVYPMAVRRLTPVECERLQGFPDNYTEIPWRGKAETPDGPRYKALGNSMAVPVMQWIGGRINDIQDRSYL